MLLSREYAAAVATGTEDRLGTYLIDLLHVELMQIDRRDNSAEKSGEEAVELRRLRGIASITLFVALEAIRADVDLVRRSSPVRCQLTAVAAYAGTLAGRLVVCEGCNGLGLKYR